MDGTYSRCHLPCSNIQNVLRDDNSLTSPGGFGVEGVYISQPGKCLTMGPVVQLKHACLAASSPISSTRRVLEYDNPYTAECALLTGSPAVP
jgi:hypothetical protein